MSGLLGMGGDVNGGEMGMDGSWERRGAENGELGWLRSVWERARGAWGDPWGLRG